MRCIIGLGNPGLTYANTRHNIGFIICDRYAGDKQAVFTLKTKFKADITEFSHKSEKVIIAKPLTFYNDAGKTARAIMDFYKLAPADMLVVHDDIVLPFGTLRGREGGSDAGNNGVKSITSHVGIDTRRLRIGAYQPHRDIMNDADYVLGRLTENEMRILDSLYPHMTSFIDAFLDNRFTPHTVALAANDL